jgi:integrase
MAYFRKRGCKCEKGKKCTCGATWSFSIDVGRDPKTNKRKQKTISGFKTQKEAKTAYSEMVTEMERGNLVLNTKSDTLGEFMLSYLETSVSNNVSPSTYSAQLGWARNHIIPRIGSVKLVKLTPLHVQAFYKEMLDDGLSAGHISNIANLLSKTLNTASEWGFIAKNVASVVKRPSYKPKKMSIWTQDEFEYFLQYTKNSRYHVAYLLALTTGMRIGEILALQWDSVDFKNNEIHVKQTVSYTKGLGIHIKQSPKTVSSNRHFSIANFVAVYLKKYKLEQTPNALNLVMPSAGDELLFPPVLNHTFRKDIKAANVPSIRFHDLRHTHATWLLMSGENVKVVSERLGHSNITTTLNTYAHILPNMQKAVADRMDKDIKLSF